MVTVVIVVNVLKRVDRNSDDGSVLSGGCGESGRLLVGVI